MSGTVITTVDGNTTLETYGPDGVYAATQRVLAEAARTGSEEAQAAAEAARDAAAVANLSAGPTISDILVAATSNLSLTGEQTIDGQLTSTSNVLLTGQTDASENGLYTTAAGAWARYESASHVEGLAASVSNGVGAGVWKLATTGAIVLDTTDLSFVSVFSNSAGRVTTTDGDNVQEHLDSFNLASIPLFSSAASKTIAAAYTRVKTAGNLSIGVGAAEYIEFDDGSTGVNDTYVTNNPYTAFKSANSRYFRLALDQVITPQMCGVVHCEYTGYSGADQAVPLQAYFDFIRDNACAGAEYNIEVRSDSRITFGPATTSGDFKTPFTSGFIHIWSLAYQTDNLLTIRNIPNWHHHGILKAECLGGVTYLARETPCAIVLEEVSRSSFEGLIGVNAQIWNIFGTLVPGTANSNLLKVGQMEGWKGGCGYAGDSHTGTVFALARYGTANSTAQFTAVSLSLFADLPPAALDTYNNGASGFDSGTVTLTSHSSPIFIKMADGDLYRVAYINRVSAKVFVEGWIEDAAVSTVFTWIFGGGICISGADSNIWDCGTVSAINCAIGLAANGFYGPTISNLHLDAVEIGIAIGGNISNASRGLWVGKAYFEGVTTQILTTSLSAEGVISQTDGFDLELVETTTWPRDASGVRLKSSPALGHISIGYGDIVYRNQGLPVNTASSAVEINLGISRQVNFYADTITFNLLVVAGLNEAVGAETQLISVTGSGTNGKPTTVTFDPPTGYKINGGTVDANLAFSNLRSSTLFLVRHVVATSDLKVTILGQPNIPVTVTATTGTLPTPNGSVTIADAAAPTNAELLELIMEVLGA